MGPPLRADGTLQPPLWLMQRDFTLTAHLNTEDFRGRNFGRYSRESAVSTSRCDTWLMNTKRIHRCRDGVLHSRLNKLRVRTTGSAGWKLSKMGVYFPWFAA